MTTYLKNVGSVLSVMLLGALVFWIPDIIVHDRYAELLTAGHLCALFGVLLPFCVLLVYAVSKRVASRVFTTMPVASVILAGIWCFCPLIMSIAAIQTLGLSEVLSAHSLFWMLAMTAIAPPYTMTIAFQDLSIVGLLVTTMLLVIMTVTIERTTWRHCMARMHARRLLATPQGLGSREDHNQS